jgi:hypothetical protein
MELDALLDAADIVSIRVALSDRSRNLLIPKVAEIGIPLQFH